MSAQTTLDTIWLKEEGDDKDFYGGLIQISVSLYHLTNDNPKGAKRVYDKAKSMLTRYGSVYKDIRLGVLIEKLDLLFDSEMASGHSSIDFLKIVPKIDFLGNS